MSYTFRWDKPANDVYVTGTFDDWAKSVKLDHDGTTWQKTVALSPSADKIYYKFVVDGEWTTSDAKSETDEHGNVNNYLDNDDLKPATNSQANPIISSVAPGSSTAAMAGAQPMEEKTSQTAPGAFPETPANEEQSFSVNPIAASGTAGNPIQLAPGEKVPDSSTMNSNTIQSGVHDDPELKSKDEANQSVFVAPIPASGGAGNPIQLKPGEKVPDPSEITGHTMGSNVKTDAASYEKSDAGVTPVQPDPKTDPVAAGLGPQTSSHIPESSMGMGKDAPADINKEDTGPAISSAAPASSTAAMAGQVPKEPRGEATVVDDKEDAKSDGDNKGFIGTLAGGAAAAGATIAGGAYAANEMAKDKTGKDPKAALPESAQKTIDDNALKSTSSIPQQTVAGEAPKVPKEENNLQPVSSVPEEVTKSQKEAHSSPEAAANSEAVEEKKEVEDELLKKVPESEAQGEPAPTAAAAAAATAPAATATAEEGGKTSASGAPQLGDPTAGVAALSMDDKAKGGKVAEGDSENVSPPKEPVDANKAATETDKPLDSRDVSPMSRPATNAQQTQPEVTTGAATGKAPETSGAGAAVPRPQKEDAAATTPQKRQSFVDRMKGTPSSAKSEATTGTTGTGESAKKDKRRSLFGRIKDKLKN